MRRLRSAKSMRRALWRRGTAVAALAAAATVPALTSSEGADAGQGPRAADGGSKRCARAGSVTLAISRKARVYKRQPGRERAIYGCLRGTGRTWLIEDAFHSRNFVFPPPAIKLVGTVVGYAVDSHGKDRTFIDVIDLRHDPLDHVSPNKGVGEPAGARFGFVKVGSLSLARSGSVAWISCPEDPNVGDPEAEQRPGCVHPGRRDSVWILPHADESKTLVDKGRSIDPRSIIRRGRRFCWRRAGAERCRRVP